MPLLHPTLCHTLAAKACLPVSAICSTRSQSPSRRVLTTSTICRRWCSRNHRSTSRRAPSSRGCLHAGIPAVRRYEPGHYLHKSAAALQRTCLRSARRKRERTSPNSPSLSRTTHSLNSTEQIRISSPVSAGCSREAGPG